VYDDGVKAHVSFVAALLAVPMLCIGTCCCGGAILEADVKAPQHECCTEKSAPPAHHQDECRCPGHVLIEAKQGVLSVPAPLPSVSYAAPGMRGFSYEAGLPRFVSACGASSMERPPPREIRRWLGIWLV